MEIKELKKENIDEVTELIWNVQMDFNQIPKMFQAEESKQYFKNRVLEKFLDKLKFYGIFLEGKMIGVIGHEENVISYLYVLKEYQKMGAGTKLIRYVLDLLKDYETITIDSVDYSKEFYRKIGFKEVDNDYDISMEYKRKTN